MATITNEKILQINSFLRGVQAGATCVEDIAIRSCQYIHKNLTSANGEPMCSLVRFFITLPYDLMPKDLQSFARKGLPKGVELTPNMRCLCLLGTAGDSAEWNSRENSQGHKAIPLCSEEQLKESLPMISNLVNQFGMEIKKVISPSPEFFTQQKDQPFNVFYIPKALGSPMVPAQENFVVPYSIQSVLGFGGPVPSGDIFAVILFAKVPVSHESALQFRSFPVSLKMAVTEYEQRVFFK